MKLKLCKDCRWCKKDKDGGYKYAVCKSPKRHFKDIDMVSGEEKSKNYCDIDRECRFLLSLMVSVCGEKARWFEPKEIEE